MPPGWYLELRKLQDAADWLRTSVPAVLTVPSWLVERAALVKRLEYEAEVTVRANTGDKQAMEQLAQLQAAYAAEGG